MMMMGLSYLTWLFVFVITVGTESLWVFYIRRTDQGKAFQAAIFSVSITIFSALLTISYVENRMLLIPIAAGGFVGTFISVKMDKDKKRIKKKR